MGVEIERKWLIAKLPEHLEGYPQRKIEQAYLNFHPAIRVRHDMSQSLEKYELTYKGSGTLCHQEENMELDRESYQNLLSKHDGIIIRKTRYLIPIGEYTGELDIFEGELTGLRLIEVEFPSVEDAERFLAPDWFGTDVTSGGKYSNARMAALGRKAFA